MPNSVLYSSRFIKKVKEVAKKHSSFVADLEELEQSLIDNPMQGNSLGAGLYKIRLALKSKGKGKSGGFRIITFLVTESDNSVLINMLTLYDKSEENNINKSLLLQYARDLC